MNRIRVLLGSVTLLLAFALYPAGVTAHHSWGKYHWARTSNPLTLKIGDNVDGGWDAFLNQAISDWNNYPLSLSGVNGGTSSPDCNPTVGRIEVCNGTYGQNGWLGIAQIWISSGSHITAGTTKLNDTYFNTAQYNSYAWRRFVMCQEVGHNFGLDHQDERFNNTNLGTCMDYTDDPDGTLHNQLSNVAPNAHDWEQLNAIYLHLDDASGGGGGGGGGGRGRPGGAGFPLIPPQAVAHITGNDQASWGLLVRSNGRVATYLLDIGNGNFVVTHVLWA